MCEDYRNDIDILFRDETKAVVKRVHGRKPKSTSGTPSTDAQPKANHPLTYRPQASALVAFAGPLTPLRSQSPQSLSSPGSVEDQAVCFFFRTYRAPQSTEHHQSLYAYLPVLYSVEPSDHILNCIIPAIGLGGLAHRRNDPGLLLAADAAYSKALRRTNHALQIPERASADQTLISVMLLGLYEARQVPDPFGNRD